MEEDQSHLAERILQLTLEIIYLLTGENSPSVSVNHVTIKVPPPRSTILESNAKQSILEVTKKITELLTREVPIRCEDVAVYFSMEEREYLEEHNNLYQKAMIEDQHLPLLLGGSRNRPERSRHPLHSQDSSQEGHRTPHHYRVYTPERSPRPLYSQDSTQEGHGTPHHYQRENLIIVKVDVKEEGEEVDERGGEQCMEGDIFPELSTGGSYSRIGLEEHASVSLHGGIDHTADVPGDNRTTPNLHPTWLCSDLSPQPSLTQGECFPVTGYFSHRHSEKPYSCSKFETSFPHKSHLPKQNVVHGEGKASFTKQFSLGKWQMSQDGGKLNGKCALPKSGLVHEKKLAGKKPHWCSECGKCFSRKTYLITHERIHTGEKPYSCPECGKCFSQKTQLLTHVRRHRGERLYSCSDCGKCFYTKSSLIIHRRVHTGEKPYSCSKCEKRFSEKSSLKKHDRVHTGEKPYPCSECGKGFSEKSHLIKHERFHRGDKPYLCLECGKCFSEKSKLIIHERVHTGEKPYPCSECGRCFAQKIYLIKHERVHTGEKPYSCSKCGKCFSQQSNLNKHEKLHME